MNLIDKIFKKFKREEPEMKEDLVDFEMSEDLKDTIKELSNTFSDGWFNYRIVEKEHKWNDIDDSIISELYYEIHEVYYGADGDIIAWTENPISIYFENIFDANDTIKHIKDAIKKPILKYDPDTDGDSLYETDKYLKDIK